jgi:hypothetical protein
LQEDIVLGRTLWSKLRENWWLTTASSDQKRFTWIAHHQEGWDRFACLTRIDLFSARCINRILLGRWIIATCSGCVVVWGQRYWRALSLNTLITPFLFGVDFVCQILSRLTNSGQAMLRRLGSICLIWTWFLLSLVSKAIKSHWKARGFKIRRQGGMYWLELFLTHWRI